MYKAVYLPVDKPFTDGCTTIDASGKVDKYDADQPYPLRYQRLHRVAEMFVVSYEFNRMVIIGQPAQRTGGWIKQGMEIKEPNVTHSGWHIVPGISGKVPLLDVRCEVCGHTHK